MKQLVGNIGMAIVFATLAACETTNGISQQAASMVGAPVQQSAQTISENSRASLDELLENEPAARALADEAVAVLVFPEILKGGVGIGGQYGEGTLLRGESVDSYYSSFAGSYGLQLGAQKFAYALFFMNEGALDFIEQSSGWELGVGPSLVLADEGLSRSLSTTTVRSDVYSFVYGQTGLMAGTGLQGTKISKINPE